MIAANWIMSKESVKREKGVTSLFQDAAQSKIRSQFSTAAGEPISISLDNRVKAEELFEGIDPLPSPPLPELEEVNQSTNQSTNQPNDWVDGGQADGGAVLTSFKWPSNLPSLNEPLWLIPKNGEFVTDHTMYDRSDEKSDGSSNQPSEHRPQPVDEPFTLRMPVMKPAPTMRWNELNEYEILPFFPPPQHQPQPVLPIQSPLFQIPVATPIMPQTSLPHILTSSANAAAPTQSPATPTTPKKAASSKEPGVKTHHRPMGPESEVVSALKCQAERQYTMDKKESDKLSPEMRSELIDWSIRFVRESNGQPLSTSPLYIVANDLGPLLRIRSGNAASYVQNYDSSMKRPMMVNKPHRYNQIVLSMEGAHKMISTRPKVNGEALWDRIQQHVNMFAATYQTPSMPPTMV